MGKEEKMERLWHFATHKEREKENKQLFVTRLDRRVSKTIGHSENAQEGYAAKKSPKSVWAAGRMGDA